MVYIYKNSTLVCQRKYYSVIVSYYTVVEKELLPQKRQQLEVCHLNKIAHLQLYLFECAYDTLVDAATLLNGYRQSRLYQEDWGFAQKTGRMVYHGFGDSSGEKNAPGA